MTRRPVPVDPRRSELMSFFRLGFLGFSGQGVSLYWRIIVPDLPFLRECLPMMGLPPGMFDDLWPHISTVEIGRDGSEVVWVTIPYWTHQRNGNLPSQPSERCTTGLRRDLAQQLRDLGVAHRADEISVASGAHQRPWVEDFRGVPDDPYKVRLWWD